MESGDLGIFSFLLVGLLAGYIAEKVMNRDHGLLKNLVVGVIGAYVGAFLASLLGIAFFRFSSAIWSLRPSGPLLSYGCLRCWRADDGSVHEGFDPMVNVLDTVSDRKRVRHPEKAHRPDNEVARKPDWIRVKAPTSKGYLETRDIVKTNNLVTVCEEAGCPNIGSCWQQKHASFMIMGEICTRACAFCNVSTGRPTDARSERAGKRGASAVREMGLKHVVVTSVDRDDLDDGGAQHFVDTILAIRSASPETTVEILTPDFLRKDGAVEKVVSARPDVFNHNLETVPSNYLTVRPGARYFHSIRLLQRVKELDPDMFTKSGIMVGLGEERNEVLQLMDDLRVADVDFLTIGQYLQPTRKHHKVEKFVTPEEFKSYETIAYSKGFLMVSASPLTRSSHHAGDDFAKLQAARAAKAGAKM